MNAQRLAECIEKQRSVADKGGLAYEEELDPELMCGSDEIVEKTKV